MPVNPLSDRDDKPCMRSRAIGQHGFTLVEVLIASAILSFATLAIVQAVTAGQAQTLDALKRARAQTLAEVLLEEIISKPYNDPEGHVGFGPDADEATRTDFDNTDDYHNLSESPGSLADQSGTLYPDAYQVFGRSVAVESVINSVAALGGDHAGLQVTVTVYEPAGRTWVVRRFIPEPEAG